MITHLFVVLVNGFRSLDLHGEYSEDAEDAEEDIAFMRRKLATITKVDTPEVGGSREIIRDNFWMLSSTHGKTCLDGLLTGILHRKDGGGSSGDGQEDPLHRQDNHRLPTVFKR